MTIIFDALKKSFDFVAPLIKFSVKIMFNPEVGFIGNAHCCSVFLKTIADRLTGVSPIGENFFA